MTLTIKDVKITYQQGRWEFAVIYDSLPVICAGSGATQEEAFRNAIVGILADATFEHQRRRGIGAAFGAWGGGGS